MELYGYQFRCESDLRHHGILGMKWGVRRYQNKDGSLTELGKTRKGIKALETNARENKYKEDRANGGGHVFKYARVSTGKNYDKAVEDYYNQLASDKKLAALSKKANNAEYDKIMIEKKAYDKVSDLDDSDAEWEAINKVYGSKKYLDLDTKSQKYTKEKEDYIKRIAESYIDKIKEAKLTDLNITGEDRKIAKAYISDRFNDFYWDGNLDWNPDNFYEPGWENYHKRL